MSAAYAAAAVDLISMRVEAEKMPGELGGGRLVNWDVARKKCRVRARRAGRGAMLKIAECVSVEGDGWSLCTRPSHRVEEMMKLSRTRKRASIRRAPYLKAVGA